MTVGIGIVPDTRISSAEFGDYHYKRFLSWCFVERQSKAAFLRNVAVSRTESNREEINHGFNHYCKAYGLTEEELLECLTQADANNVSIAQLHERLESGLRGEDAWGKRKK
jgi:hypothetical protein